MRAAKGAEVAPVGGVGAFTGRRAAGLGGRAGVGAQLVDRRHGVGGEDRQRVFFFWIERFGRDRHAVGGSKGASGCVRFRSERNYGSLTVRDCSEELATVISKSVQLS
jgi:hypothetical protein